MICENCGKEHDGTYGSGRFCSEKCARKFSIKNDDLTETKIGNCIICNKEITINKRASVKKCLCDSCYKEKYGKYKKIKPEIPILNNTEVDEDINYCLNCNSEIPKQKKFCNNTCQNEYNNKEWVKKWQSGEVSGLRGHYQLSSYLRTYLLKKYNYKCAICGWSKKNIYTNTYPLEVDHIDGNYLNNSEENLIVLCPNCHSLTKTYKGANKGNGRKERKKYY